MHLFYILLVLLVVARGFGEIAKRLGQPVLVGELVAGIVLGLVARSAPGMFPVLSTLENNDVFKAITDLAVFFLMLLAGLELKPSDLSRDTDRSVLVAIGGMVLPLAMGLGLGWYLFPTSDARFAQSLFLGVSLAITAVPVSVKVLMDLDALDTRVGKIIITAAVVDDVLSLVLLAFLTAVIRSGHAPGGGDLLIIVGSTTLFLLCSLLVGRYLLQWLGTHAKRLKLSNLEFTFVLVSGLGLAVLAEQLGLHFILGAFAAGLFFERRTIEKAAYDTVREQVDALSTGFLAPIFFASIGMHLELSAIVATPWLVVAVLVAATVGKMIGAGVPARLTGASRREATAVGLGMNARGAVELIIAGIALEAGLFARPDPAPPVVANLFSAVVIMAVVTTLGTSLFLGPLVAGDDEI